MDGGGVRYPHPVDEVFRDFKGRRVGLITALTDDAELFFSQCDPEKEHLCLYGYPNEQWEVSLPAEKVPPELPEPVLGINFARDGMQDKDWLSFVAKHSDAWLHSVAFYFAARYSFNKDDRKHLFKMMNGLPTIFEVVTGSAKKQVKDDDGNEEDDNDECGICAENYDSQQFWICCDFCETWFHCKCVKITPDSAQDIKLYKCLNCTNQRTQL